MAPQRILYLPIEGVLVPESDMPRRADQVDAMCLCERSHVHRLANSLANGQHFVIINSVAVARFGFRRVFDVLPYSLQQRVVGATVPGNRLHRLQHKALQASRSCWLERDVQRRKPLHIIVIESDARYVPVALRGHAVMLPRGLWKASDDEWMLLDDAIKGSEATARAPSAVAA